MKKLIHDKAFMVGFFISIFFLLCLNIFIFFQSLCHHCVRVAGFPFIFWAQFMGNLNFTDKGVTAPNDFEYFLLFNLIADIFITVVISFGIGLIFKSVWLKLTSRGLELK